MVAWVVVLFLTLAICYGNAATGYDETAMQHYRSKRMNLVFEKLQNRLNANQLSLIDAKLAALDSAYIALKHEQKVSSDIVAVKRKDLDKQLIKILADFGIQDVVDWLDLRKDKSMLEDVQPAETVPRFSDKKLNKLWVRAQLAIADRAVLEEMRKKFVAHDQLILNYHELAAQVAQTRKNEVGHDDLGSPVDEKRLLDEMKQNLVTLQNGYRQLVDSVETLEKATSSDGGHFHSHFVAELWNRLEGSSVDDKKKAELCDELRRMDRKMSKLNIIKEEMANVETKMGKSGKNSLHSVEYKQISRQMSDMEKKVAKMESYIRSQIKSEL